ncbi:MAG: urease accessory protein UreE [Bacteroidota bacterium]|nr:urease accessory protein UreE [Bacteroidota bacterium]
MLIQEKSGNINSLSNNDRFVDALEIEWYETNKRILHKKTKSGIEIILKFLGENPDLKDGDILWEDKHTIIAVEIISGECLVIEPQSMLSASSVCYEIGNKHLPLFYEGNQLLIPYEVPLHNYLLASGYEVKIEMRKLNNQFRTTVLPHLQVGGTGSLIQKITKLSTSA